MQNRDAMNKHIYGCTFVQSKSSHKKHVYQARIQKFFKGGGIEEKNFERKIIVDTRINACTHKN